MEPNSPGWYGDEPEKIPPLQTHGIHDSEWVPPVSKSRFVSYQKRDEDWMKFFGLGSFRDVLRPIYDVRLSDGSFVGYTCHNPSEDRLYSTLQVAMRPYRDLPRACPLASQGPQRLPIRTIGVSRRKFVVNEGCDSKLFMCWVVDAGGKQELLETDFIALTGSDRISEFIAEMRRKRRFDSIAKMTTDEHPREFKRTWLGTWSDPREETEKKPDTPKRIRDMSFGE